MAVGVSDAEDYALDAVTAGKADDPFAVLGPHPTTREGRPAIVIRTMQPSASAVEIVDGDRLAPMTRVRRDGLFEATIDADGRSHRDPFYRLRVHEGESVREVIDPYRFGQVLTDFDLHLFSEGTHYRAWEKLGSRRMTVDGIAGVHFAVWAPNAQRVSVIGDVNRWDGRVHPMRKLVPSGVWEIFIPGLHDGACYKLEIRTSGGHLLHKTDPYGRFFEVPPNTASVVYDERYTWRDDDWMRDRPSFDGWRERPMSIYEVHPGSWRRVPEEGGRYLTYRELAETLVPYVREMGFTHIELMPVMEHPFSGSWGYQVIGFFAPTSRYGTPDDFRYFVDQCHVHGLGVILDWVPGHFPKDRHGLAEFDGTALYEHADPRKGEHQDWGTLIFNYGRNEVRTFLLSNALFWLEEFHVDGLRVDAVASMLYLDYSREHGQWIPNQFGGRENLEAVEFIKQLNMLTHGRVAGGQSAGVRRRSRLQLQVEHGLDARHARVRQRGSRAPPMASQPGDVLDALRLHRELRAAVLARRGRARQAIDARQDAW
jgi:1,4-alpha-glucan branching enzyme